MCTRFRLFAKGKYLNIRVNAIKSVCCSSTSFCVQALDTFLGYDLEDTLNGLFHNFLVCRVHVKYQQLLLSFRAKSFFVFLLKQTIDKILRILDSVIPTERGEVVLEPLGLQLVLQDVLLCDAQKHVSLPAAIFTN